MFSLSRQFSRIEHDPASFIPRERLEMGDFGALVDPSSGDSGRGAILESSTTASNASHIARLSGYFAAAFRAAGTGSRAPGGGGATARGGAY
jgi:hypothetical protein